MTIRPPQTLIAGRVTVRFITAGDRYSHTIFIDDIAVATSVDGDAESDWPESPPLQELHSQDIDGDLVILGVGAAGTGHWSISVTVGLENAEPLGLHFELACRSKLMDQATLGSEYEVSGEVEFMPSNNAKLTKIDGTPRIRLEPTKAINGTTVWSYIIAPQQS